MSTLRRILKYTPAVVMGLLVVVWLGSGFGWAAYLVTINQQNWVGTVGGGSFSIRTYLEMNPATTARGFSRGTYNEHASPSYIGALAGYFGYYCLENWDEYTTVSFPIALPITLILPFAIGPFLSFRFCLWHYLAYTALVALELAYYLQWQE